MPSKLWRKLAIATNWPVLAAVAVLSAAGIIAIWEQKPDAGVKQLAFLAVAVVCLMLVQAVNYTIIGRYAWAFYFVSLLLVLYTAVGARVHLPGVEKRNGAYAWINFGLLTLEPSELMKISFVMVLARYLRFRASFRRLPGLLPPFGLAFLPVALILAQPDLGVAALFFPTLLAMLFVAGAKARHIGLVVALAVVMTPIFWFSPLVHSYQRERFAAMFSSDPAANYQQDRALAAMGAGGAAGKGLGNLTLSRHIPEAENDMIFAVIGEQFGFAGSAVVLLAYIVLFAAGIEISAATREPFGRLVALGIVVLLATQTLLNLMVVMRLFPVTGVTLPFVSSGGSSLVASFIAAGLLLNIGQTRPLVVAREAFEFS
jgi:cell division protein FtsW (lipid II flippase)